MRIAINGPAFWAKTLAGQLREAGLRACWRSSAGGRIGGEIRFLLWFLRQAARRSIVHMLGASCGPKLPMIARLMRTPLIYHWIGSDAFRLLSLPEGQRRKVVQRLNRTVPVHVADSQEVAEELRTGGLKVMEVARLLPPSVRAEVMPLPSKPAVMCYWTDAYAGFHRADMIMELARRFPDVPFKVAAAKGAGLDAPPNVEFLGWQDDLTRVYFQCSIFLRLPEHDSLSAIVLEALVRGRYVIYNRRTPHCRYAETLEQACEALGELRKMVSPNESGAAWVKENFDPVLELDKLVRIYSQTCRAGA